MSDVVTLLPAGTGSGVTGAAIDAGELVSRATIQLAVSATTSAMSASFQGSIDGTSWDALPLSSLNAVTGAKSALTQPYVATNTGAAVIGFVLDGSGGAWRYFRAVTGTITGATVGAKIALLRG
jgi:hypothetical protein